ncbi:hypothetical protein DY000_02043353 [Brassica cretica]|uniref:Prolamin-like domain-containing protein n=1 Tax=Brassica cretica TaxID=69181 RepID=A0ABQ7BQ06_BRACR|nr:hypothetical protein DY000_02043353 [Brassica cretica]
METKTIFTAFFFITTLVSSAYPNLGQEDTDDEPLVNPGREFDTLDAISPASQDYNNYMLENLPSKYMTYLETCGKNMGPSGTVKCNVDVLKEILTNKPISRECCQKVVKAGKECYMEIRKFMFRLYQLKRFAYQVSFKIIKVILDEMITILTPSYERDKTSNKEDKEEESRISYCASSLPEGIKHIGKKLVEIEFSMRYERDGATVLIILRLGTRPIKTCVTLCVKRILRACLSAALKLELLLNETPVLPEALVDDGIGVPSISFCFQPRKTTRSKTRGGCRRRKRTVTVSSESKGQTFLSARRNPPRFFIKIGRTRGMLRLREDEETPE